jgi:hypothetical protein
MSIDRSNMPAIIQGRHFGNQGLLQTGSDRVWHSRM